MIFYVDDDEDSKYRVCQSFPLAVRVGRDKGSPGPGRRSPPRIWDSGVWDRTGRERREDWVRFWDSRDTYGVGSLDLK